MFCFDRMLFIVPYIVLLFSTSICQVRVREIRAILALLWHYFQCDESKPPKDSCHWLFDFLLLSFFHSFRLHDSSTIRSFRFRCICFVLSYNYSFLSLYCWFLLRFALFFFGFIWYCFVPCFTVFSVISYNIRNYKLVFPHSCSFLASFINFIQNRMEKNVEQSSLYSYPIWNYFTKRITTL